MAGSTSKLPSSQNVSLVGKVPGQADFIRCGRVSDAGQRYFRWLSTALAQASEAEPSLPLAAPLGFFVHTQHGPVAGVMIPSRDKIGRLFPLSLMVDGGEHLAGHGYDNISRDLTAWLQQGVASLKEFVEGTTPSTDVKVLENALEQISSAQPFQAPLDNRFAKLLVKDLHGEMFDESASVRPYYAYKTLQIACRQASATPSRIDDAQSSSACVVDCPLTQAEDAALWLMVIRALCPKGFIPSFFWTLNDTAPRNRRLLASLTAVPVELLAYLAGAHAQSSKFWPLLVQNEDLASRSKASFPSGLVELEQQVSVSDFLNELVGVLKTLTG